MESVQAPQGLTVLVFGVVKLLPAICPIHHQLTPVHTGSHGGLTVIKWLNGDAEEMEEGYEEQERDG